MSWFVLIVMSAVSAVAGYFLGLASGMREVSKQWAESDRFLFKALREDIERSNQS